MEEVREPTVGERIRAARERAGKSRPVVAGLLGKSAEWLKAVENGRLQPPRLNMLVQIAKVLNVANLSELTGSQSLPVSTLTTVGHPATPDVQRELLTYPRRTDREPLSLEELEGRLHNAWRLRHASPNHRSALGELLPSLIREAQYAARAYDGDDRRRASAVLSEVYGLSQFFLAYQPNSRLVWLVADRAMSAAQDADDPLAVGNGAWALAQVLRESGETSKAREIAIEATDELEPYLNTPDNLGAWGSLQFDLGLTAAAEGSYGAAWRYWDTATKATKALGPNYYHRMTSFSQVILDVHAVTLDVELGKPGEAIRRAESFDPRLIPSRPRRARHLIEVARAYYLGKQKVGAAHLLLKAHDAAPETIRYNAYARDMATDLLRTGGSSIREEAQSLVAKLELTV